MFNRVIGKINRNSYKKLFKANSVLEAEIKLNEHLQDSDFPQKQKVKLSKTQIKQYLLYHFLPLNSEGVFEYVIEQNIADELNVDIKTVRRNNKILKAIGLIKYHRIDIGCIAIKINDYNKAFETGNSGTINIPNNVIKAIIQFKEMDMLKCFLLLYAQHFSYLRNTKNSIITKHLLIKEIKKIIPNGKNYDLNILRIFNKLKDYFDFIKYNKIVKRLCTLEYKVKERFLTYKYDEKIKTELANELEKIFKEKNIDKYITYKVYDDIYSLCNEYGKDLLLKAINNFNSDFINKKSEIGAIIRNEIKNYLIMA